MAVRTRWLLVFVGILGLFGCSQPPADPPAATPTLAIPTRPAAPTRTATNRPTATSLPTSLPTLTPAPTDTPLPSPTPWPVLDSKAAEQEVIRLLNTNNHCFGLCFWGISPGMTRFDQAVRTLGPIGKFSLEVNQAGHNAFSACYRFSQDEGSLCVNFSESNGVVSRLDAHGVGLELRDLRAEDWLGFRPDNILKANGVPKQVGVQFAEGPEGRLEYFFSFLYDHMAIEYYGSQLIIRPQTLLRACPNVEHNIQEFKFRSGAGVEHLPDVVDISSVSNLTPATLTRILTLPPGQACFELDFRKFELLR